MKKFTFKLLLGLSLISSLTFGISPFELPWMNGLAGPSLFVSESYKGVYIIETYFLGCPYCNDNAENVNKIADHYKLEPRVLVLDMGVDRQDSQYEEWINRHKPNHPVLKDANRKVVGQLGTTGYPSSYVLDQNLNVVFKTSGPWSDSKMQRIKDEVDKLLAKMP